MGSPDQRNPHNGRVQPPGVLDIRLPYALILGWLSRSLIIDSRSGGTRSHQGDLVLLGTYARYVV